MDQQMGEGGGGDNNAYSGKYYYGKIYTVNIDKWNILIDSFQRGYKL